MLPRECDSDECDYDSYTDSEGRARVRWIHDPSCNSVTSRPDYEYGIPQEYYLG